MDNYLLSRLYIQLKKNRYNMTKQQYRTIKGQLNNGDYVGAVKGMQTIIKNRITNIQEAP